MQWKAWVGRVYVLLLGVAVLGALGTHLLPLLARVRPFPFDLLVQFKHLYLFTTVCMLPLCLLTRRRWIIAVALLTVVGHAWAFIPYYLPRAQAAEDSASATIKIAMANVNRFSKNTQPFLDWIAATDPDVVIVQELTVHWAEALKLLEAQYPVHQVAPSGHFFGMGVYHSLDEAPIMEIPHEVEDVNNFTLELVKDGKTLHTYAIHAFPPMWRKTLDYRNEQFEEIAAWSQATEGAKLVIGDLNSTPWSPYFKMMLKEGALRDTRLGYGVLPSWDTKLPAVARIPIDHALVSPEVQVHHIDIGPDIGSDHFPILVEVGL